MKCHAISSSPLARLSQRPHRSSSSLQSSPERDRRISINLLNFAWQHSSFVQPFLPGVPGLDPLGDTHGLLGWSSTKAASALFYTDDDARALLAGLAVRSLIDEPRWDTVIAAAILANVRLSGINGFGA